MFVRVCAYERACCLFGKVKATACMGPGMRIWSRTMQRETAEQKRSAYVAAHRNRAYRERGYCRNLRLAELWMSVEPIHFHGPDPAERINGLSLPFIHCGRRYAMLISRVLAAGARIKRGPWQFWANNFDSNANFCRRFNFSLPLPPTENVGDKYLIKIATRYHEPTDGSTD